MPDTLSDRAADLWEPLLAIADLGGESWSERARTAARVLSGAGDAEDESLGVKLLSDIQGVFNHRGTDRIA